MSTSAPEDDSRPLERGVTEPSASSLRPKVIGFRAEAIAHAYDRRYGRILLTQSLSSRVLTAVFVLFGLLVILFLFQFEYTRKVQVPGWVVPSAGSITLVAPQAGILVEQRVADGSLVRSNDVIFVVNSDRQSGPLGADSSISASLELRRASLRAERDKQLAQWNRQVNALRQRQAGLASEVERIDSQVALQERRLAIAEASLGRFKDLAEQSYVSPAAHQDRLADVIDQRQRLGDYQRSRLTALRELTATQDEARVLQIQGSRDQDQLERDVAVVEQDLADSEARRLATVRSTQNGRLEGVSVSPGQYVVQGQTLATILPEQGHLEIELYAPSRATGLVSAGNSVLLKYSAFPYQKYGQFPGRVREISSVTVKPPDAIANASSMTDRHEPLYRIRVELGSDSVFAGGQLRPLRVGMLVDASLMIEKRRIYQWILDPLYTLAGRV